MFSFVPACFICLLFHSGGKTLQHIRTLTSYELLSCLPITIVPYFHLKAGGDDGVLLLAHSGASDGNSELLMSGCFSADSQH